jgi:hypothetical protein
MRPLMLLTLTVLLLLPGCMTAPPTANQATPTGDPSSRPQTGGSPDVPAWTVNDHWVLRTYPQGHDDDTMGVEDEFVQAIDVLVADGAEMDAFRVVSQQENRTTWYRMSDLALMKEETQDGNGLVTTVYDRPCAPYMWPLSVGNNWTAECARSGTNGPSTLNFTAIVEGEEQISVPTGNFSTFRIRFTGFDGGVAFERTEYFAPSACFPVRTVTQNGTQTLVRDLIAYQCTSTSSS